MGKKGPTIEEVRAEYEEHIKALQAKIRAQEDELGAQIEQVKLCTDLLANAQSELSSKETEIASLAERIRDLESKLKKARAGKGGDDGGDEELKKEVADLKSKLRKSQQAEKQLEGELERLEQELEEVHAQAKEAQLQARAAGRQLQVGKKGGTEDEADQVFQEMQEEMNRKLKVKDDKIASLNKELEKAGKELERSQARVKNLEDMLNSKGSAAERDVNDLKMENGKLREKVQHYEEELEKMDELEEEWRSAQERVAKLEQDVAAGEKELAREIAKRETENNRLREDLKRMQEIVEKNLNDKADAEGRAKENADELKRLKKEKDSKLKEAEKKFVEEKAAAVEALKASQQKEMEKLRKAIEDEKATLVEQYEADIEGLQQAHADVTKELQRTRKELALLKDENEELHGEIDKAKEREAFQEQLALETRQKEKRLRELKNGRVFTKFNFRNSRDKPVKVCITTDDDGAYLHWGPEGKTPPGKHKIPIREISKMIRGLGTPVFESRYHLRLDPEKCVSLVLAGQVGRTVDLFSDFKTYVETFVANMADLYDIPVDDSRIRKVARTPGRQSSRRVEEEEEEEQANGHDEDEDD
eukprot:tig00000241_g20946.t1